ncbi:MAG: GntR family transcriptional regulator [Kiritimatiellae bacterium]|nr:GntR family transcriptional regulator [Kiritimatiellia bacterium]
MGVTAPFEAWLTGWLARMEPGSGLPPDVDLAREWHVSYSSIRRVLERHAAEGRLVRVRGRGTFIPAPRGEGPPPDSVQCSSVKNLTDTIVRSISRGELKTGEPLPPRKILCRRFHLAGGTVRQAYAALERDGLVTRAGRRYWVGGFRALAQVPGRRVIYAFTTDRRGFQGVFESPHQRLAFRKMENELFRHGYTLHFEHWRNMGRCVRRWNRVRQFPLGLIFTGADGGVMEADEITGTVGSVRWRYARVLREPPPILIVTRASARKYAGVTFFSVTHGDTVAMRTLAGFLFRRGIRRADVFLAPRGRPQRRVVASMRLLAEIQHLDPEFQLRIVMRGVPDAERADTRRRFLDAYRLDHMSGVVSKYRAVTPEELERVFVFCDGDPARFRAHVSSGVWVFTTERHAVAALDWCKRHGVRVPGELEVISMESTDQYLERGMTVCEPDWESAGYMLAHALMEDIPIEKSGRGYLQTTARLVERLTTR